MNDDVIDIYDGALTREECAHILQRFGASDKYVGTGCPPYGAHHT